MRLGVLDIGSNTGHLLVVDARGGAAPMPAYSHKEPLRLAPHIGESGCVDAGGVRALGDFVASAVLVAEDKGCSELAGFATSAVRDAANCEEVLEHVRAASGVDIEVLAGEDEARLTFLAVRRWFGWSSGRLAVFDIGGGSLEIAVGSDEAPDVAQSLPLGAGRLTRDHLRTGAAPATVRELRRTIRAVIAADAGAVTRSVPDHSVATSKTFRSLARICGAAPSVEGPLVRRGGGGGRGRGVPDAAVRRETVPKLLGMSPDEVAELPGVSPSRAHQVMAGALV